MSACPLLPWPEDSCGPGGLVWAPRRGPADLSRCVQRGARAEINEAAAAQVLSRPVSVPVSQQSLYLIAPPRHLLGWSERVSSHQRILSTCRGCAHSYHAPQLGWRSQCAKGVRRGTDHRMGVSDGVSRQTPRTSRSRALLRAPCQPAGLGENMSCPLFMLLKCSSCGLILVSWGNRPGL